MDVRIVTDTGHNVTEEREEGLLFHLDGSDVYCSNLDTQLSKRENQFD